jgi:hypothetical protein
MKNNDNLNNNFYLLLFFVFLFIITIGPKLYLHWIKEKEIKKENESNEIYCNYNPVCGKDNKTYVNKCRAKLAGIEIAYEGTCNKSTNNHCTNSGYVCGVDNKTYNNCDANIEILHNGNCRLTKSPITMNNKKSHDIICTTSIKPPACGINNKTYRDSCDALANGIEVAYDNICNESIECKNKYYYDPVCGKDNKTYVNSCRSKLLGIDILYKGFCKENNEKIKDCINIGPICGIDNITYNNSCDAPVEILYKGECIKS